MKLFVALLGRDGELLDSHLFFYHRYIALADHHWLKGKVAKAVRLEAIAEAHFQAAPGDDDPPAAAMAMSVPKTPTFTNAVGRKHVPVPTVDPSALVPTADS